MLPFTSLNAASTTGAGTSKDLEECLASHMLIIQLTGSPSSIGVDLEGSHDGSVWTALASISAGAGSIRSVSASGKPVRYVRANLNDLSGGSSPTVTATIASA